MKSIITRVHQKKHTTSWKDIFNVINDTKDEYNWLVTDRECYSMPESFLKEIIDAKYWFLTTSELLKLDVDARLMWCWGTFSAFEKSISLEDILKHPLPYANGNTELWQDKVKVQHPLATMEVIEWDSTYVLFISKDDEIVNKYMQIELSAKDLEIYNRTANEQFSRVEKLLKSTSEEVVQNALQKNRYFVNNVYWKVYQKDEMINPKDEDILEKAVKLATEKK